MPHANSIGFTPMFLLSFLFITKSFILSHHVYSFYLVNTFLIKVFNISNSYSYYPNILFFNHPNHVFSDENSTDVYTGENLIHENKSNNYTKKNQQFSSHKKIE